MSTRVCALPRGELTVRWGADQVIFTKDWGGEWEGGGLRVTPGFPVGNWGGCPSPVTRTLRGGLWEGSRHPLSGTVVDAVVTVGAE